MDVKAVILLGETHAKAPEAWDGVPVACLDVLGRPVLHRIADRLYRFGLSGLTVVGDAGPQGAPFLRRAVRADFRWISAPGDSLWRAAQRAFSDYAQNGADLIIILRLGAYAEIDFEHLLQFHLDQNSRVTAVAGPGGELLGAFVISASRRNDAAFLLRHRLQDSRAPLLRYPFSGYLNPMATAGDLRRLAVDAFCGRVQIAPDGDQIRPGLWVARGARVHRGARVLAPAFIGEHAKVRACAVITRCSVLEHHTEVDCGTVVEDATLLPYTSIGAGLDVAHSVVGFRKVTHLQRLVEVEISDPRLVSMVAPGPIRVLNRAALLAGFLPLNFFRALVGRHDSAATLPAAAQSPSAALKATDSVPATDPAFTNFR
jgi:hypothetical protein